MIKVSFKKINTKWVSYTLQGHANFADHGKDIVCAAVSALAITTTNNIERLAKYQPICSIDEQNGGYLYVEVLADLSDEQQQLTQLIIEQLYLSLSCDIAKDYPDFVTVEIVQ